MSISPKVHASTFTWAHFPEGKRKKTLPPLDKRLEPMVQSFKEKFGEEPTLVFLKEEMLGDKWGESWEKDTVLGLEIRTVDNLLLHTYALAVNPEDYLGETTNEV